MCQVAHRQPYNKICNKLTAGAKANYDRDDDIISDYEYNTMSRESNPLPLEFFNLIGSWLQSITNCPPLTLGRIIYPKKNSYEYECPLFPRMAGCRSQYCYDTIDISLKYCHSAQMIYNSLMHQG